MSVPGKSFGLLPRHWVAGDADVVCPACRSRALFTQPYGYVPELNDADPRLPGVQWGGGFAVERFPDVFPWRDPDNPWEWEHGREKANWGVICCPHCGVRRKHLLDWPKDAFYRAESAAGLLGVLARTPGPDPTLRRRRPHAPRPVRHEPRAEGVHPGPQPSASSDGDRPNARAAGRGRCGFFAQTNALRFASRPLKVLPVEAARHQRHPDGRLADRGISRIKGDYPHSSSGGPPIARPTRIASAAGACRV
jgi:hypothetical protein